MSDTCGFSPGGPPLNTDVGGIGVRLSFYLQTIFLAWLSARSRSVAEISGALYTLIATNMATIATSLILRRIISFDDALVVLYLIFLSWLTVTFSLPALSRFPGTLQHLKILSIIQTYFAFAFTIYLLVTAQTFGKFAECNGNAMLVLFRPFRVFNAGRIVAWTLTLIAITIYTIMTVKDYSPRKVRDFVKRLTRRKRIKAHRIPETDCEAPVADIDISVHEPAAPRDTNVFLAEEPQRSHITYDSPIAWDLVIELVVTTVLWALAVMNTELLIVWNRIQPQNEWVYGQILPLCLVVVPFTSVIDVFRRYGLRKSFLFENSCSECNQMCQK